MPFTAKIKREDPFCSADQREIYAMCRRIAGAAEHCSSAGWREESGYRLYHFTTWAKARAMQHWIDRSGIAHRPMPKLGPTPGGNSRPTCRIPFVGLCSLYVLHLITLKSSTFSTPWAMPNPSTAMPGCSNSPKACCISTPR